jgi:hypothetical protein
MSQLTSLFTGYARAGTKRLDPPKSLAAKTMRTHRAACSEGCGNTHLTGPRWSSKYDYGG